MLELEAKAEDKDSLPTEEVARPILSHLSFFGSYIGTWEKHLRRGGWVIIVL